MIKLGKIHLINSSNKDIKVEGLDFQEEDLVVALDFLEVESIWKIFSEEDLEDLEDLVEGLISNILEVKVKVKVEEDNAKSQEIKVKERHILSVSEDNKELIMNFD